MYIHKCIYMYTYIYTCIYMCINAIIYIDWQWMKLRESGLYSGRDICTPVCIFIYARTHTHMYT